MINTENIKSKTGLDTVVFKENTTSTNDEILNYKNGDSLLVSFHQSKGKGRYGRKFYSPQNGMYFSLLLDREVDFESAKKFTPIIALAVSDAVDEVFTVDTSIKWVNDILLDGKKICGILTQSTIEGGKCKDIIIGVGINVYETNFPDDIKTTAGFISKKTEEDKREILLIQIIKNFYDYLNSPLDLLVKKYREKSKFLGKIVNVHKNDRVEKANALSINDDFSLKVRYENGIEENLDIGEIFL